MRFVKTGLMLAILLVCGSAIAAMDFGLGPVSFGVGSGTQSDGSPGLSAFSLADEPMLAARIVPERPAFVPGTPFRVFVELVHKPGTYSYWANPGGPGVATSVAWTLPDGFRVDGPEWPPPRMQDKSGIVSYVIEGKSYLVYTVTPPDHAEPGQTYRIEGEISSQVCTPKTCNPVKLSVQTDITAATDLPAADPVATTALAALPTPPRGWTFEAAEEDGQLVMYFQPGPEARTGLEEAYFFDNTAPAYRVDSTLPQKLEKTESGFRLRIPMLPGVAAEPALSGVVAAKGGWLDGSASPEAFAVDLLATPAGARPAGIRKSVEHNIPMVLLFAFFGGLLLNIMPCVFPVIGLKIMSFAKQAHKDRQAVFLHGACYTAGVLLCFWTLAFLVITMGRGWGAQLQSDLFMFALCHIFMIMSMNMAGVFDVAATVAGTGQSLKRHEGLKRSFFTGLLATITSTPCSAPFLGTALAYALSLPAFLSLGVFTLMGLGFSFPYLALSLFPGWLKRLPKPGAWMDTFRQAMCFPLFATTAYLFWTIEAMLDEWRFLMLLFGLVMTAMACWLYGKSQKAGVKSPRLGKGLFASALFVLLAGVWLGIPKADKQLEWGEWSPERVMALRDQGRPVYVDFTARWCATCQVNKRVYQDKELAAALLDKNVALLKADWTLYDDRITSTLRSEFDKAAVPVTVLYMPGRDEAEVLPEILSVSDVMDALGDIP